MLQSDFCFTNETLENTCESCSSPHQLLWALYQTPEAAYDALLKTEWDSSNNKEAKAKAH